MGIVSDDCVAFAAEFGGDGSGGDMVEFCRRVHCVVQRCYERGYRCFIVPVADVDGVGLTLLETVLSYKLVFDDILVAVVLPYRGFVDGFRDVDRVRYMALADRVDYSVCFAKKVVFEGNRDGLNDMLIVMAAKVVAI